MSRPLGTVWVSRSGTRPNSRAWSCTATAGESLASLPSSFTTLSMGSRTSLPGRTSGWTSSNHAADGQLYQRALIASRSGSYDSQTDRLMRIEVKAPGITGQHEIAGLRWLSCDRMGRGSTTTQHNMTVRDFKPVCGRDLAGGFDSRPPPLPPIESPGLRRKTTTPHRLKPMTPNA
jgi:hypothetical protein